MKREINREKGFTRADALVTLIVMTMIITTCVATIPNSMNKARESAWIAICANQMRQIGIGISSYADDWDGMLPFYGGWDPLFKAPFYVSSSYDASDEIHNQVAYRWDVSPWVYTDSNGVKRSRAMKLACLYEAGIINDPSIFYCPANQNDMFRYESYCDSTTGSKKWGEQYQRYNYTSHNNPWIRIGYTYYPIDKNIRTERPNVTYGSGIIYQNILPGHPRMWTRDTR